MLDKGAIPHTNAPESEASSLRNAPLEKNNEIFNSEEFPPIPLHALCICHMIYLGSLVSTSLLAQWCQLQLLINNIYCFLFGDNTSQIDCILLLLVIGPPYLSKVLL